MVDQKKISFISCVNDDAYYNEVLFYINQLVIPDGYSVDCLAVRGADSMVAGYQQAMQSSNAKYKVYLHQDVHIVNEHFLADLLAIFNQNNAIGLVGMAGSIQADPNAVWWHQPSYGGVYQTNQLGRPYLNFFNKKLTNDLYLEATLLDGLLLATQYDLPWRTDLLNHWHMYDISQSCEFLRRGHKVVIANQFDGTIQSPWCIHYGDNGSLDVDWHAEKNKVVAEYTDILRA